MTPALEHRNLRSAAAPSKRDKEHEEKLTHDDHSALEEENLSEILDRARLGERARQKKKRTSKAKGKKSMGTGWSVKFEGRKTSKSRAKIDISEDSTFLFSQSLVDLLQQYENDSGSAITMTTAERMKSEFSSSDDEYFPVGKEHPINLDKLVDRAEKTWEENMIETIVNGEYEVLDAQGEKTILSGKGKKKLKQKMKESKMDTPDESPEEDDGFELV